MRVFQWPILPHHGHATQQSKFIFLRIFRDKLCYIPHIPMDNILRPYLVWGWSKRDQSLQLETHTLYSDHLYSCIGAVYHDSNGSYLGIACCPHSGSFCKKYRFIIPGCSFICLTWFLLHYCQLYPTLYEGWWATMEESTVFVLLRLLYYNDNRFIFCKWLRS